MSDIDAILKQVPMEQVAAALGIDVRAAEAATRVVIPALLGGMQANASDPAGAASLADAVASHDTSALGADLDHIDTSDGQRIVENVFGDQAIQVAARIAGMSGLPGAGVIEKLLPIVAPIVMAYLAKKLMSDRAKSTRSAVTRGVGGLAGKAAAGSGAGAAAMGEALGSMRRGGRAGKDSGEAGDGIGDLIGETLGDGGSQTRPETPVGHVVGGVLGGLLGGGKR